MFKKIFLLLMISASAFAQNVETINPGLDERGEFYYPRFSPDGSQLLLTTVSHKGLWLYDLSTKKLQQLNDYIASGYRAQFSDNGEFIIYRKDDFINNRRFSSVCVYDKKTGKEEIIEKNIRSISSFNISGQELAYWNDSEVKYFDMSKNQFKTEENQNNLVFEKEAKMLGIVKSERLAKNGNDNKFYLWVSTAAGKRIYTTNGPVSIVTDLEGNEIKNIGYSNYPSLSGDGGYAIYMKDYDDGQQVTSSAIYLMDLNSGVERKLTAENEIAMYPAISKDAAFVAYNTIDGKIRVLKLKF